MDILLILFAIFFLDDIILMLSRVLNLLLKSIPLLFFITLIIYLISIL